MTEDQMIGWNHQLNGHEFEQASGVGDGQGSLACQSPWGCKGLGTTEQLSYLADDLKYNYAYCKSRNLIKRNNPSQSIDKRYQ